MGSMAITLWSKSPLEGMSLDAISPSFSSVVHSNGVCLTTLEYVYPGMENLLCWSALLLFHRRHPILYYAFLIQMPLGNKSRGPNYPNPQHDPMFPNSFPFLLATEYFLLNLGTSTI